MRRDLCGTGGMDAQEAKIYVPGSLTTVVKIKTGGNRGYADGSEWGHNLMKNAAKADGQRTPVVATTINEQSCVAVAVPEEVRGVLDAIAPRCTESPHTVVIPPIVGWIPHAGGEVTTTEVNDGVKVIGEVLTEEVDVITSSWL